MIAVGPPAAPTMVILVPSSIDGPEALAGDPGAEGADQEPAPSNAPIGASSGEATFARLAKFAREDEDYRSIRLEQRDRFPLKLKERALTHGIWASLGGDYRFRVEGYDNSLFGLPGTKGYTAVENRFLLHANLELQDVARVFVQVGAGTEGGRIPGPLPGERSGPDLVQGFVDVTPRVIFGHLRFRVGRQEFLLGQLFTSREATNFRQAFDGLRVDISVGGWNVIGFAGRPVMNAAGSFDDGTSRIDRVATISVDHKVVSDLRLQAIFVTRHNEQAFYAQGAGDETRRSYGARLFGNYGRLALDAQSVYQEGKLRQMDGRLAGISAWGFAIQAELALAVKLSPRAGLRIDAGSGDANPSDRRLGTLDIPYPGLNYLSDATIFAPRNSRDLQAYLTFKPVVSVTMTIGDQLLWRMRKGDAVYTPPGGVIAPPSVEGGLISNQPYLRGEWNASPLLTFQASFVHASRGEVLRRVGASTDINYFSGAVLFRF